MGKGPLAEMLKGTVEMDETFVGGKPRRDAQGRRMPGYGYRKDSNKIPVLALVERDGNVRTKVVPSVSHKNLRQFINENVDAKAIVNTDEYPTYRGLLRGFASHDVVVHKNMEYARFNLDGTLSTTNSAESFFSLIKRGVYGSFHHVSPEHLHRYATEFEFRWNHRKVSDGERTQAAIKMVEGKRLTYQHVL